MLTSKERIIEVLDSIQDGMCDDCLSEKANVSPRQQANSICREMGKAGILNRRKASCQVCGKAKLVNILKSSQTNVRLKRTDEPHDTSRISQDPGDELDSKRRQIIQIFNQIDKNKPSANQRVESFAERLSRLNDKGVIPPNVVAIMRFLNNLRNVVVYDNCKLGRPEIDLFRAAWEIVCDWRKKSAN